jgi:ATP-dependent Clp protease ATP-binding subunit ClpA
LNLTKRTLRILKNAEKEAERTTKMVYPVHLLLGMLLERTGVCAELFINNPGISEKLNHRIKEIYSNRDEQGINYEPFITNISLSTQQVLENASCRMKRLKQNYLNEGHLVDAIFKSNDPQTIAIIDGLDVSRILEIVSYPRDMIVSLKDYSFPNISTRNKITFRKAEQSDANSLKLFVQKEFGYDFTRYRKINSVFGRRIAKKYKKLLSRNITTNKYTSQLTKAVILQC